MGNNKKLRREKQKAKMNRINEAITETTMKEEKKRNLSLARFTLCFLITIFSIAVFVTASAINPDSDSLWLISTGKWIAEHKSVPKINPFTHTENMKIIIQQPLCALLNYWWTTARGGISHIWELAMIENVAFIFSVLILIRKKAKNNPIRISLSIILIEVFLIATKLITTRPFLLTMTNFTLFLCVLEKVRKSDNFKGLFITTVLCTLFQANYQMASLIFIPAFATCYAIGIAIDRLKNHTPIRVERLYGWVGLYLTWFLVGMINPYGINGFFYLSSSVNALQTNVGLSIVEMKSPEAFSLPIFICIYSVIVLFRKLYRKEDWSFTHVMFVLVTTIATMLSRRNFWMTIIAFALMYMENVPSNSHPLADKLKLFKNRFINENFSNNPVIYNLLTFKVTKTPKIECIEKIGLYLLLGVSGIIFGFIFMISDSLSKRLVEPINELVTIIQELPEDAKIYTGFNTGSYVEYAGRKIFIDSRPELYYPDITGNVDLLTEWQELEIGNTEPKEYVTSNDWDYYLISENSKLYYYFEYSGVGQKVFSSKKIVLYKVKE